MYSLTKLFRHIYKQNTQERLNSDMDTDYYCNGLKFNDILIPEELIILILTYVDVPHLLNCRLVCKHWNVMVTSNTLWFSLYRRKYRSSPKALPWHLYYHLFTNFFDTNLLKNVNGENKFGHWQILSNGGNRFKIEKQPAGSEPLPKNVPEFGSNESCFATSYDLCSKKQFIYFKESQLQILRKYKPHVYVSEWIAPRFDCGCKYSANIALVCKSGEHTEKSMSESFEQWAEAKWKKMEMVITNYPKDVDHIEFFHCGQDTQFWAGHYGVKMAGAVVKLLFQSIPPDPYTDT